MKTFDEIAFRNFVGLQNVSHNNTNYPPYNIEQTSEDNYVISLAVSGFNENEIDISLVSSRLKITGEKTSTDLPKTIFLHRGLSFRDFEQTFTLAEYVQVISADLSNGILSVKLERQVPESAKPKKIPIGNSQADAVDKITKIEKIEKIAKIA